MKKTNNKKYYVILHVNILIYAVSSICSKMAATQNFLSYKFILLYAGALFCLFVYAIIWQQILKHISLTTGFLNKAVTIIWGMIFGVLLFHEKIEGNMIMGALIVFAGVKLVVSDCDE